MLQLYNTLSGEKETFKPIKKGQVLMYQCGPTTYDTAHIGNLRTYVSNDIFRRVFEYNGYKVNQAMNFTDVDDKTIRRSRNEKVSLKELTLKYEKLFLEDMDKLNILRPSKLLRATDHIKQMISMTEVLLGKGFAYKSFDGVYMNIRKVKDYGQLAGIKLEDEVKERIANDEYEKENARDFALWKFWTEDDGENFWEAPFGKGRPGWHIECSAMSASALGETIDVHTGAVDLIFPHHTNEIAQSESATGKPFVHYWLHAGFMNVNDEKMAKSKGNFLKLGDIEAKDFSPIIFRYWLLSAHYRTKMNFSFEALEGARSAYKKLIEHIAGFGDSGKADKDYIEKFNEAIDDDFNMPKALALVWEIIKDEKIDGSAKRATILEFDKVLGIDILKESEKIKQIEIPKEILDLISLREKARKDKNFEESDKLRKKIESAGYEISDTDKGPQVKIK